MKSTDGKIAKVLTKIYGPVICFSELVPRPNATCVSKYSYDQLFKLIHLYIDVRYRWKDFSQSNTQKFHH